VKHHASDECCPKWRGGIAQGVQWGSGVVDERGGNEATQRGGRLDDEATDAMIDAFTEIRSAAGLSTDLTPVGSAMPLAAAAG